MARECYIAMLEMDNHLQTMCIKEQGMVAELVERLKKYSLMILGLNEQPG